MRPSAFARRSAPLAAARTAPARRSPAGAGEASLYDEVTGKIIAQLEAGRFPWDQPWGRPQGPALALPRNGVTGRCYSGVNILLLWGAAIEHGYPWQGWLTFRQALAAGGAVRRGEHGTTVVFADRFTPKAEQERAARDGDEPGQVAFLKRFKVFNLAQCEGLEGLGSDPAPVPERQVVPVAEALIAATGADFRIGGARAYYAPALDYVQVPPQPAFTDQINYYRTAFHELAHWTGHPTRLARDQSGPYGGKAYGREELVAELGAAFVCASLGVTPTVRHADYLGAWLDILREDNRAIFRAASQASKAADLLLSFQADPAPPPAKADALAAPGAAPLAA